MRTTKKQLKALIREQVAAALDETEWRDVSDQENYFEPHSQNIDNTEASMTPNKEVEAEQALMAAVEALVGLGYSAEEIMAQVDSHVPSPSTSEPEVRLSTPAHDPMDRSALGKYRRGKMTDFKEGMPEVAGLMSQAGAYAMHPNAMQRLIRVIKEFAPNLSDEELHDFAQQLIDTGALETALGAPEEAGLEEGPHRAREKK